MAHTKGETVSSLEFSPSGSFLAVGYTNGRCTIYIQKGKEYVHYVSFYVDGVGSVPVVQIRWGAPSPFSLVLIITTTNSTMLFRVPNNRTLSNPPSVHLKRHFQNDPTKSAHPTPLVIHSLSMNSDGETFLTADELKVYLWHLHHSEEALTIFDSKPKNFQLLTEVMNVVEFHPSHCNILAFGTSKGTIGIYDTRTSPLCTLQNMVLSFGPHSINNVNNIHKIDINEFGAVETSNGGGSVFRDYLHSISDLKLAPFSGSEHLMVSRDYERLVLWDLRATGAISVLQMHPHDILMRRLYDTYEAGLSHDRFYCTFVDNKTIVTGSYEDICVRWDILGNCKHQVINLKNFHNPNKFPKKPILAPPKSSSPPSNNNISSPSLHSYIYSNTQLFSNSNVHLIGDDFSDTTQRSHTTTTTTTTDTSFLESYSHSYIQKGESFLEEMIDKITLHNTFETGSIEDDENCFEDRWGSDQQFPYSLPIQYKLQDFSNANTKNIHNLGTEKVSHELYCGWGDNSTFTSLTSITRNNDIFKPSLQNSQTPSPTTFQYGFNNSNSNPKKTSKFEEGLDFEKRVVCLASRPNSELISASSSSGNLGIYNVYNFEK